MDKNPKPDSVVERKFGSTTYIVSSCGEKISETVIKEKLFKLIEARAAEEIFKKIDRED